MQRELSGPNALGQLILRAIRYSNFFDYPLTAREVWYWLPNISRIVSRERTEKTLDGLVGTGALEKSGRFYFLPRRQGLVARRKKRERLSQRKWQIAHRATKILARIPTIRTIAVTGSLAMDNCDENADIDLMIIVSPQTLWLTRFLVWLLLNKTHLRRAPLTTDSRRIRDKICDNVYLDSSFPDLRSLPGFPTKSFYLAHEILQARPIFDRDSSYHHFLLSNTWVGDLLPNAFKERLREAKKNSQPEDFGIRHFSFLLFPLNFLLFVLQYLFMKSKMTNETVSLRRAFFHPSAPPAFPLGSY